MTTMTDYAIRCRMDDVPQLYALAARLGALAPLTDLEGNVLPDTYGLAPERRGGWDVIGPILRPTGQMVTVTAPDGAPLEVPEMAPVLDSDGVPFWHANLRIDMDLATRAAELAPSDPAIADGLSDLARWFVVNEETGRARLPKNPARCWA